MNSNTKTRPVFIIVIVLAIFILLAVICSQSSTTNSSGSTYNSKNYSSFTNKYGTPSTKCHHAGCNNYIASSGDTNCCIQHSNRCLECGCYIDEDAMFCIDCLRKATGQ